MRARLPSPVIKNSGISDKLGSKANKKQKRIANPFYLAGIGLISIKESGL
jgi:hypothetical protein